MATYSTNSFAIFSEEVACLAGGIVNNAWDSFLAAEPWGISVSFKGILTWRAPNLLSPPCCQKTTALNR